jgi:hypothetical protein
MISQDNPLGTLKAQQRARKRTSRRQKGAMRLWRAPPPRNGGARGGAASRILYQTCLSGRICPPSTTIVVPVM